MAQKFFIDCPVWPTTAVIPIKEFIYNTHTHTHTQTPTHTHTHTQNTYTFRDIMGL
jgi:hypothetical protein